MREYNNGALLIKIEHNSYKSLDPVYLLFTTVNYNKALKCVFMSFSLQGALKTVESPIRETSAAFVDLAENHFNEKTTTL